MYPDEFDQTNSGTRSVKATTLPLFALREMDTHPNPDPVKSHRDRDKQMLDRHGEAICSD